METVGIPFSRLLGGWADYTGKIAFFFFKITFHKVFLIKVVGIINHPGVLKLILFRGFQEGCM